MCDEILENYEIWLQKTLATEINPLASGTVPTWQVRH
jgi:hypothetical protein